MAAPPPPLIIMALKAFGDLVIARTSLARAGEPAQVMVAIADHLAELDAALAPARPPLIVAHGEGRVPSLFDLKKNGVRAGVQSAIRLRRTLGRLPVPRTTMRVFDKVDARERFITSGAPIRPLPPSGNVYHAYAALLGDAAAAPPSPHGQAHSIGVFPASRIKRKNVPLALITRVLDHVRARGFAPKLFLLEGERPDLEAALPQATIVPRKFAAMLAAVRGVDAVISADSMPAHMAEHAGRPVFVLSPVDNRYWLPRSSFEGGLWTQFHEAAASHEALDRFLVGLRGAPAMGEAHAA